MQEAQRLKNEDEEYIKELEWWVKKAADLAIEFKEQEYQRMREVKAQHQYAILALEEKVNKLMQRA